MRQRELRVVLEWLGLVEPDRSRREPIALPSWAPWVVTVLLVFAAALGAVLVSALLGLRGLKRSPIRGSHRTPHSRA